MVATAPVATARIATAVGMEAGTVIDDIATGAPTVVAERVANAGAIETEMKRWKARTVVTTAIAVVRSEIGIH
jgi:hypothetical protein